jgi:hypothetical protein
MQFLQVPVGLERSIITVLGRVGKTDKALLPILATCHDRNQRSHLRAHGSRAILGKWRMEKGDTLPWRQ